MWRHHGRRKRIGEATVRLFVERGAQVVIADLDEARGRALEEQLNGKAVFCRTDVSDSAQVKALFDMVEEKYALWTFCSTTRPIR